jgi:predicted ester cyclase
LELDERPGGKFGEAVRAERTVPASTPKGKFLGLDSGEKKVSFTANVFYEFLREKMPRWTK